MARFGLCGGSYQSQSPNVDAEFTANWYPEPVEANGRSALAMYPSPGLSLFATLPGAKVVTGTAYAVPQLVQVATATGTVAGTGGAGNLTVTVAFPLNTTPGNLILCVVRSKTLGPQNDYSYAVPSNGSGQGWNLVIGASAAFSVVSGGHYNNSLVNFFVITNAPSISNSSVITVPATVDITFGLSLDIEVYEFSGIATPSLGYQVIDVSSTGIGTVSVPSTLPAVTLLPNDLVLMTTVNTDSDSTVGPGYTLGASGINVPGATQYLVQGAPGPAPLSFGGVAQASWSTALVALKAAVIQTYQNVKVKSVVGMLSWENRLFAVANLEPINDLTAWALFEVFQDGTTSPTVALNPGTGKNNGWGYFVPGQGGYLSQALASMAVMPTNPGQLAIATGGTLYVAKLDHSSLQPVTTSPGNIYRQVEYVDGFLVATLGNSIGSYTMSSIARLGNTVTAVINNPTGQSSQLRVNDVVNVQNVLLSLAPAPKSPTSGTQILFSNPRVVPVPWTNPGNLTTPGTAANVILTGGGGFPQVSQELLASAFGEAVPGGTPVQSLTVTFTLWSDTENLSVGVDLLKGGLIVNGVENDQFGNVWTVKGSQVVTVSFATIDGVNPIQPSDLNNATFGPGFNVSAILLGGKLLPAGKTASVSISNVVIQPVFGNQTQFNGLFPLTSVVPGPGTIPTQFTVTWTQAGEDNSATIPGTLGPLNQQGSNQFQISNLFDATNWLPINQAGIALMTDEVISMIVSQRLLWFFGRKKTIPYYNTGQLFPFSPIPGVFIEKGAGAQLATVRLDNSIFWIEADERGWATAQRGTGYTPTRISNHGLENKWASYPTVADAIGYPYAEAGHNFWVIYFPSANATDVYDVNTGQWCTRGLLNNAGGLDAHLGQCHAFCFGKNLVGDRKSGNIYAMSIANLTDAGTNIKRIRRSPAIAKEHEWLLHHRLEVLVETGLPSNLVGPAPFPTAIILVDSGGQQWQVTVTDAGVAVLAPVAGMTPNPPIILNDDQTNTTCWQLGVSAGGGYGQGGYGQGPYGGGGAAILIGIAVPFRSNQLAQVYQMATTPGFLQTGIVFTNAGVPQIIGPMPYQIEPQLFLRWSDDGGHTWSNYQARGAGLTGQYGTRLIWRRLGRSRNRIYEISTTDPIAWRIIDGFVLADPGFAPTERLTDIYRKLG